MHHFPIPVEQFFIYDIVHLPLYLPFVIGILLDRPTCKGGKFDKLSTTQ